MIDINQVHIYIYFMNDKKQAYLIMAHKYDFTFRTLIKMLDNKNNDIFIHMDKKI